MKKHNFLAFDIGATSGRAVVGVLDGVKFEMHEISRFPNDMLEIHGRHYWNIFSLFSSLKESLRVCAREGIAIDSIGIDTWGVDFGCIGADGSILGLPRAYRDPYTEGEPERFFGKISRETVYGLTGIQVMNFNSLYQLSAMTREGFSPLLAAEKILFIPDLLSYMLTGNMVCEYTDASTSQILNPATKRFEPSLLRAAGVKPTLLEPVVMPGTKVGTLTDEIAESTGVGKVPVIAVAGHDTASAVAAVPAEGNNFAYLSSGTWSLMGIETEEPIINEASFRHNFTNEGGIEGTTRFLKNITGMWLLEQCRREWEKEGVKYPYPEIVEMAQSESGFASTVNPDDARFSNPESMTSAIASFCTQTGQRPPESHAQYVRCIFSSLARRYGQVLDTLREMAPFPIEKLHVIGGGSKNSLLNRMTADVVGIPVVAGPSEATAIGNCMVQAKAAGIVSDRKEMRRLIARCVPTETFIPGKN